MVPFTVHLDGVAVQVRTGVDNLLLICNKCVSRPEAKAEFPPGFASLLEEAGCSIFFLCLLEFRVPAVKIVRVCTHRLFTLQ